MLCRYPPEPQLMATPRGAFLSVQLGTVRCPDRHSGPKGMEHVREAVKPQRRFIERLDETGGHFPLASFSDVVRKAPNSFSATAWIFGKNPTAGLRRESGGGRPLALCASDRSWRRKSTGAAKPY